MLLVDVLDAFQILVGSVIAHDHMDELIWTYLSTLALEDDLMCVEDMVQLSLRLNCGTKIFQLQMES